MQNLSVLPRLKGLRGDPAGTATGESALSGATLLTVQEVAEMLSISVRQTWRLASAGTIPAPVRLSGRIVRWRLADLAAFVSALD
jgi:excisionase family DNA binding protein